VRAPFQVLVIPFRRESTGTQYAVLKRSDADYWQFVAGGGEDKETPLEAAEREVREEIGVEADGLLRQLDSMSTVPKESFAARDSWGEDVYVIPEYCFALDIRGDSLQLSREHTEVRWVEYEEANQILKWDSNRNALWELDERLRTE